jgi:type VI secretion system protein ImpA
MTPTEIAALGIPLSPEEPCGPDLDQLGDAAYMHFIARIDSVLPTSLVKFKRSSIDFSSELAALQSLLSRSRDLRLLVPLAKLSILNRDIAAYAAVIGLIEKLTDEAWEPLAPRLLDGNAKPRIDVLRALDDMVPSVLQVQAAPLFETRRFGPLSYRSRLLAEGTVAPRQGEDDQLEKVPEAAAVATALQEVDIKELIGARSLMVGLGQSLNRLEELVTQKAGKAGSLQFPRLKPLVQEIVAFLDKAAVARDPASALTPAKPAESQAPADVAPAADSRGAAIGSTAQAQEALAVAAAYFARSEPSSPILLVIRQVQALVGLSFFDSMHLLLPDLSPKARLALGPERQLTLPFQRLAKLTLTVAKPADGENGGEAGGENETRAEENVPESTVIISSSAFSALDRREAMALLQKVSEHFRRAEPSSPIPLLLEGAGKMVGKDFVTLLRDSLPTGSLSVDG